MRFENSIERRISGKHRANLRMLSFRGKRVIDIGCGIGIIEKNILKDAKKVLAIEPFKKDLEIAKRSVKSNKVNFICASVFEINKITNEKFDIAMAFDVIEHLPKGREIRALKKINFALNKRVKILISTPANNISKFFDPAWYFGHRHYNKKEIAILLEESGFKIQKIYIMGGVYEIINMFLFYIWKWIFDSEVPFKKFFDKKRDAEYLIKKRGFVTLFAIAEKK